MRLDRFRAVVFDLDDTLYLERDYVLSGFRAVGRHLHQNLGWPTALQRRFVQACWQRFQAGARSRIFDEVLSDLNVEGPPPSIERLVDVYRTHPPEIRLQPDACALLEELGPPRAWIVTDGHRVSQKAKVAALDLARRVQQVIYTDDWGPSFWKPHPRAFRRIERLASASGPQCIYVADNPAKDFQAPRRLGWSTVRVRRSGGLHAASVAMAGGVADMELPHMWTLRANQVARERRRAG